MKRAGLVLCVTLPICAIAALGQAPAAAPVGANGICKDGTYSTAATKNGACRGHKGVQTWYSPASSSSVAPTEQPSAHPVPESSVSVSPVADKRLSPAQAAAAKTAAPGGGPGLVWLNTASNVYHCIGDPFYGKTKVGAYLSEQDAKAKGAHGERGRTCGVK